MIYVKEGVVVVCVSLLDRMFLGDPDESLMQILSPEWDHGLQAASYL